MKELILRYKKILMNEQNIQIADAREVRMGKPHIYVACGGLKRCSNNFCPLCPGDLNPGYLSKGKKVDKLADMIWSLSFIYGLPTEAYAPGCCAVLTCQALESI